MIMSRLLQLSPLVLVAAANTMLGLARDNTPDAEVMLREVGQPAGRVWDTAFVYHVGYWSHYDHGALRSVWPLPMTNDCNVWARFAKARGVLLDRGPRRGDVFLIWSARRKRYAHTGIVAECAEATGILPNGLAFVECETIEGNVNAVGRWPNAGIHRQTRRLVPERGDRFIRWAELDEPAETTMMATPAEVCRGLMLRARVRDVQDVQPVRDAAGERAA